MMPLLARQNYTPSRACLNNCINQCQGFGQTLWTNFTMLFIAGKDLYCDIVPVCSKALELDPEAMRLVQLSDYVNPLRIYSSYNLSSQA